MISWQSIMSVFNTKGTLLKWLQKLEKALKDGVLLSVTVNTVSEGVITLTFNFADGSAITTPQIDLPQGAQGPQGPKGEQGPQGPQGPQGISGITQSTVIERSESLPTATADSPDFVQTPDGTLYRKKAVEGGSLLGTWRWNDTIKSITNTFNFSFTSNNTQYIGIKVNPESRGIHVEYLKSGDEKDYAATGQSTVTDEYRNINITDISALTNEAEFTSWLTANATKQGGGGGTVTYSYVALADAA